MLWSVRPNFVLEGLGVGKLAGHTFLQRGIGGLQDGICSCTSLKSNVNCRATRSAASVAFCSSIPLASQGPALWRFCFGALEPFLVQVFSLEISRATSRSCLRTCIRSANCSGACAVLGSGLARSTVNKPPY